MQKKTFVTEIGGKTLTAEFTDLADQAHGSAIVRYGNTVVLATAVMSEKLRNDIDYFPLTVDYEEKFYAAGQILGSRFMRREGRPSDEAILSGRVVDRTIRPLFDHRMRNDVQVIITVLSIDEDDPDVLAVIAASLALGTSNIPWGGPVSAIRIGKKKDGTKTINPTYLDRDAGGYAYDLLACGRDGTINMIEVGAEEVSEDELGNAFEEATKQLEVLQSFQKAIIAEIGKEKRTITPPEIPEALIALFNEQFAPRLPQAVISGNPGKNEINALKKEFIEQVKATVPDGALFADHYFEEHVDQTIHEEAVVNNRRADGRRFDEVRPLSAEVGTLSPMAHGTGVFYRGGTHVFTALTLGGPGDSQIIDSIENREEKKRFMHHYNFPPFAPGETGRMGGMNRRAIGHGALAEKALLAILPPKETFPYTIRLVSECMASNGSTSMGSVCASTLALMDGGVPITRPVAGIAMGLMKIDDRYKVLTDIQGPEDHHGDMDFKVAGTSEGITAIQMDIKLDGIPVSILREALVAARDARLHILKTILAALPAPRPDISARAPKILTVVVKKDQIGLVIGPGGKTINKIREDTKVDDITIEEDGTIFITGKDGSAELAKKALEELTHEYKAGETFEGEVTRLMEFGAFVRIGKNTEGLVHISEIAPFRVNKVTDALKEGERVSVIIKEIDDKQRINLSIKAVDPTFAERKGLSATSQNNGNGTGEQRTNNTDRRHS
jgi:polyribonucleotide nucleotidyltransferase